MSQILELLERRFRESLDEIERKRSEVLGAIQSRVNLAVKRKQAEMDAYLIQMKDVYRSKFKELIEGWYIRNISLPRADRTFVNAELSRLISKYVLSL